MCAINHSSWLSCAVAVHGSRRMLSNTTLVTGLWNLHREEWPSHDRYQERCCVCILSSRQMESLRITSYVTVCGLRHLSQDMIL